MRRLIAVFRGQERLVAIVAVIVAALGALMFYRLGTLVTGFSDREVAVLAETQGWRGLYNDPLNAPLNLLQSVVFFVAPDHGTFLSRLPNVVFGVLSIASFAWLISFWHNRRTTILTTVLFATGAWTLHASRLATYDVLYLWALPTLLLIPVLLHNYPKRALVWYSSILLWGVLLYVPGLVWLIVVQWFLHRKLLAQGWAQFGAWWQRTVSALAFIIWLPLLVYSLVRDGGWLSWLGAPDTWPGFVELLRQLLAVPFQLFVRGPAIPDIWLGRLPILDIFSLALCLVGIYFYAVHWRSSRTRNLFVLGIIGVILVGMGGPVGLSLLVPLLYVFVATGMAYLLHDWLKVFPRNPIARSLGISLIALAVTISAVYNIRAYFVAWPNNPTTQATFREQP